jgi:citronellol/citronellal dehydrogenase
VSSPLRATPAVDRPTAQTLKDRTLIMSGGSRGIGLAIAVRAAQDGARVALLAKTATPHPRLEGTIYTAADAIIATGGTALPIVCDIRDDEAVAEAAKRVAREWGGIDICVNNASAIDLSGTESLDMRKYDLMHDINARGTFFLTKRCLPYLRQSSNPHVLNLSPPLNLAPKWLGAHVAYTATKFAASMYVLGMAEEFRDAGIAFNGLWPRTLIATDAVRNILGGPEAVSRSRKPAIIADAAHAILTRPSRSCTGNLFIDEDVLREEGITDLSHYSVSPGATDLAADLYVE